MSQSVIKIPSELFALAESSHFEGELPLPLLEVGPDDYAFADPVKWSVDATNTGAAILVAGTVTGVGACACSRCLEDVTYEFEGDIEGYYLIEGQEYADSDDEDDPGADEFDVLPDDHIIDLEPLIRAALIVDAPQMPLCRDDCAGLCPTCGANLNEGECSCGPDEGLAAFDKQANPFAALADFKFE